ncbi:hypothetical protein HaLaN_11868 [Haematococcus lacustris]|uniref:Uncharacterized protein n=1 Tax=Haematococcus lacustris TaxID=44745 RepID=A0A699Z9V7_HAELA|nr:hypothetical protein HaLaN_11868 [Haematococcus lacustris]
MTKGLVRWCVSGYSSLQAAQSDSNAASKLSNSALLHVVPPVPVIRALWTAPFMRGSVAPAE